MYVWLNPICFASPFVAKYMQLYLAVKADSDPLCLQMQLLYLNAIQDFSSPGIQLQSHRNK